MYGIDINDMNNSVDAKWFKRKIVFNKSSNKYIFIQQ